MSEMQGRRQGPDGTHTQEQEMLKYVVTVATLMLPLAAQAQSTDQTHGSGMPHVDRHAEIERARNVSVRESGQSGFAAIQEIVSLLESDTET